MQSLKSASRVQFGGTAEDAALDQSSPDECSDVVFESDVGGEPTSGSVTFI
jgi:hypothetical protein